MIEIHDAVKNAMLFVKKLYSGQSLQDLSLEEIELSDDEKHWKVTVGFRSPSHFVKVGGSVSMFNQEPSTVQRVPRDFKQVFIDTDTGKALPKLLDRDL